MSTNNKYDSEIVSDIDYEDEQPSEEHCEKRRSQSPYLENLVGRGRVVRREKLSEGPW